MAASCAVPGFELVDTVTGGAGGTAGAGPGGSGGSSACESAEPPNAPDTSDPGPDDVDFVVATRSLDFGEEFDDDGPSVGYDLDTRCTCLGGRSAAQMCDSERTTPAAERLWSRDAGWSLRVPENQKSA